MAAPGAVDSGDSAALGAQVWEEPAVPGRAQLVPEEPAVPGRAQLVLAQQRAPADVLLRLSVLLPSRLAVRVRPVPADPLLEPVPAHWVLDPVVPVDLLLSRPSF